MGHSSITITLDRYGHLLPSLDDQMADGLERMYRLAQAERTARMGTAIPLIEQRTDVEGSEHSGANTESAASRQDA